MIKKIKRFPQFLKEVKEEVKKVNWSSRKELVAAAIIVIIAAALLTCYVALIDLSLSRLVHILLT